MNDTETLLMIAFSLGSLGLGFVLGWLFGEIHQMQKQLMGKADAGEASQ